MSSMLLMSGAVLVASPSAHVVDLTQVPCQFLDVEAPQNFPAESADACKQVNKTTSAGRLKKVKPLHLKAGTHTFRVKNASVPYEVGFWLRGAKEADGLPSVSGGEIKKGMTKTYTATLVPGAYLFSCPLNPTLDYPLIVE